MKRFVLLSLPAILLAGCGEKPADETAYEMAPSDQAGPGISPTAAPGVAFNYRYAFRLPSVRIATVQEEHAQTCEKMGIARCRITGMRYRVIGEDNISAMLSFKLAPDIARKFGKDGIAAVEQAEGMVVDTEISGVDTSGAVAAANRNVDQIDQDIAALEAELAKGGLKSEVRADLLSRIESLRSQRRSNVDNRIANEEAVANTPMTFEYGSGGIIPGFDPKSPIIAAFQTAGRMIVGIIAFLIVALSVIIPWALVIGGIAYLLHRLRPAWVRQAKRNLGLGEEQESSG
jgi:hypothetical protein